jgi:HTH-type transcriptional regulator/antitoxin HipB
MTPSAYPVRFPDQLRQHLRGLRKSRGLTQAQLGRLVGVSQARIAEIEAQPAVVNVEQLMKILGVMGVTLTLQENQAAPANDESDSASTTPPGDSVKPTARKIPIFGQRKGSW